MDGQAFFEIAEERRMSDEQDTVSRQFLLKQLENEVNAAFAMLSVARKAYRSQQISVGDEAVKEAFETYRQASAKLTGSAAGKVRAITHQLTELREAIEWLHANQPLDRDAGSPE